MPQTHIQTLSLPGRAGFFTRLFAAVTEVANRRRDRLRLARLDAHLLRDIGLDAREAEAECAKPFWQP
jgi:uncharacterized protein YjiS (DUF1127 family)